MNHIQHLNEVARAALDINEHSPLAELGKAACIVAGVNPNQPVFIFGLGISAWRAKIVDKELWEQTLAEEAELRKPLKALHGRWNDVKKLFNRPDLLKPEFWYKG